MNPPVTVDASIFVSAFTPSEPAHAASKVLMRRIHDAGVPIIVPSLVVPEIAAALARGQGKPDLGMAFAGQVASLPNVTIISVDESLAHLAAQTAATYKLRGSDSIYAAVALRFGTHLLTLDREQLERLAPALPVSAP